MWPYFAAAFILLGLAFIAPYQVGGFFVLVAIVLFFIGTFVASRQNKRPHQ